MIQLIIELEDLTQIKYDEKSNYAIHDRDKVMENWRKGIVENFTVDVYKNDEIIDTHTNAISVFLQRI